MNNGEFENESMIKWNICQMLDQLILPLRSLCLSYRLSNLDGFYFYFPALETRRFDLGYSKLKSCTVMYF